MLLVLLPELILSPPLSSAGTGVLWFFNSISVTYYIRMPMGKVRLMGIDSIVRDFRASAPRTPC